jgi:PD-(D/E)XK nuclease superfamily protein
LLSYFGNRPGFLFTFACLWIVKKFQWKGEKQVPRHVLAFGCGRLGMTIKRGWRVAKRKAKITQSKAVKAKVIEDKKQRGEWAEMKFMARAAEHGLPVSKPWGDSNSFDCVVGRPGKFVAVQVKSTIAKLETGKGYICSTCSSHKAYRAGAFDFLAAYVALEDAWYIMPAKEIRGLKSISLCTQGGEAKYEKYREAWDLLREAAETREDAAIGDGEPTAAESDSSPVEARVGGALGRLQAAGSFFKNYLERSGVNPQKRDDEV